MTLVIPLCNAPAANVYHEGAIQYTCIPTPNLRTPSLGHRQRHAVLETTDTAAQTLRQISPKRADQSPHPATYGKPGHSHHPEPVHPTGMRRNAPPYPPPENQTETQAHTPLPTHYGPSRSRNQESQGKPKAPSSQH